MRRDLAIKRSVNRFTEDKGPHAHPDPSKPFSISTNGSELEIDVVETIVDEVLGD